MKSERQQYIIFMMHKMHRVKYNFISSVLQFCFAKDSEFFIAND